MAFSSESTMTPLDDETERLRRICKVLVMLIVFWFVMLYLLTHHDDRLVTLGLVLLGLWMLYMCFWIVTYCCLDIQQNRLRQQVGEEGDISSPDQTADVEVRGLTETEAREEGCMAFPIEVSAQRIRQCSQPRPSGVSPTNGTYSFVYSAMVFHKTIRSEGTLELKFQRVPNGWEVTGSSIFSRDRKPISEGFVNSIGEMYWKTSETVYRGMFDLENSNMFNGEFLAPTPGGVEAPAPQQIGRIVRLELLKGSYYSGSLEMVTLFKDNYKDDGFNDEEDLGAYS
eukprot:Nitzschia sp. Nitz4//scaffold82_size85912//25315//26166//NITZ4_005134-RA/size85912-processed-gene-0.96-mRNA-1//1//CDS//3329558814//8165//frame0